MKHLEGKVVYLLPTGNNARYSKDIQKAAVVKVAKVFATIVINGYSQEKKLRFKDNRLSDSFNGGYLVFESVMDCENHLESISTISRIKSKVSEYGVNPLTLLTLEQLKQIEFIIDSVEENQR